MAKRGAALIGVAAMITAIVLSAVFSTVRAKEIGRKPPPDGRGDVDMDGWVTQEDSALVEEYLVGNIVLSPGQLIRADVDGDGQITIYDVLAIDQYAAGQIDTFPRG